jgi:hypothetical protein
MEEEQNRQKQIPRSDIERDVERRGGGGEIKKERDKENKNREEGMEIQKQNVRNGNDLILHCVVLLII